MGDEMSAQWGHGFHSGIGKGQQVGEAIGSSMAMADIGMKALCLATAIREAQKADSVSQYVLCEILIDLLSSQCGGRIGNNEGKK